MSAVFRFQRSFATVLGLALVVSTVLPSLVDARGRFGGARMPRMNVGGHFNSPHHFGGPGFHGGGRQFHPGPRPYPAGGFHPRPGPYPHPPGPGPRPRPPGPGPRPLPPPPVPYRPLPPPLPYYPGYHYGAAVAWTAGAIALGAVVASVPTTCESVVVNGVTYRQCQNGWFEPRYQGHNVVYVVVPAPR